MTTRFTVRGLARATLICAAVALAAMQAAPAAAGSYEDDLKAKGAKRLMGDEIKAAMVGYTMIGKTENGTPYGMFTKDGGEAEIKIVTPRGEERSDNGKWNVENDMFCRQWSKLSGGKRLCRRVYRTGPDTLETIREDGSFSANGVMKKGNAL